MCGRCQRSGHGRGRADRQARDPLDEWEVEEKHDEHGGDAIGGPSQGAAPRLGDSHVVHVRALCWRSVPPLAGRYSLAREQGGSVSELRPIAQGCVDVEHTALTNKRVPAQGHRSGLEPSGLCPVAVEDHLFADHCSSTDSQEVGADRHAP